ncbi:MAG: hypothetical protein KF795_06200 [Labilithrix sp.]|nr:hypothetical protein [Labilithrix sp.]
MRSLRGLGALALGVLALGAPSCAADADAPSSTAAPGIDAADGSDARAGSDDGGAPDDGQAPGADLACLGDEAPITLAGGLPYVTVTVGEAPAYDASFLVDYGTNASTIDLSKFAPPGPAATGCDPTRLGQLCGFARFDFFGPWGPVSLYTDAHGAGGGVDQAGIVGTDFTSKVAVSLDYARAKARRASAATFCTPADFAAAGMAPLSTVGFFTNDVSKLRPLSDVIAGSAPSITVANVPTVPLRVAGVTAHAQLDTGFSDALVPFSVNVNEAFLDAVTAAAPTALVRAADKDLSLTTCAGVNEPVEAYALASGAAVELVGEDGEAVRAFPGATLFVKRTPPAARRCGGIGTWTVPAAQVAASFYAALGLVAFDPFGSRVWVKGTSL